MLKAVGLNALLTGPKTIWPSAEIVYEVPTQASSNSWIAVWSGTTATVTKAPPRAVLTRIPPAELPHPIINTIFCNAPVGGCHRSVPWSAFETARDRRPTV